MAIRMVKKSKLEVLGDELRAVELAVRAIENQHEAIFKTWRNLTDEREGLIEKLKQEARKMSEVGTTKVLIESSDLFVSVCGKSPSVSYSVEKAKKLWPPGVFRSAVNETIDPKKVLKLLEEEALDKSEVEAVKVVGDVPTPAVSIKLP